MSSATTDFHGLLFDLPPPDAAPQSAAQVIKVHFRCQADIEDFARIVGQRVTHMTREIDFPPAKLDAGEGVATP
jgi:hypothetical protein